MRSVSSLYRARPAQFQGPREGVFQRHFAHDWSIACVQWWHR